MTDQPKQDPQDDVEAHMARLARRDEQAPTEKPTGAEPAGDDDVEAHARRRTAGTPGEDDVEGHRFRGR